MAGLAAARQEGRRSGTGVRGVVEARCRADRGPGLLPGRGRCRRPLLDLPRRRRRGCCDRIPQVVFTWDLRMTRYAELQVTSHFSFLRGASSCEELFAHAANLGNLGAGRRRPQQPGRHRSGSRSRQSHRRPADRRLPARSRGRHIGSGLSDRSPCVFASVPPAVGRQEAWRQGEVHPQLGGPGRLVGRAHRRLGS